MAQEHANHKVTLLNHLIGVPGNILPAAIKWTSSGIGQHRLRTLVTKNYLSSTRVAGLATALEGQHILTRFSTARMLSDLKP